MHELECIRASAEDCEVKRRPRFVQSSQQQTQEGEGTVRNSGVKKKAQ